MTPPTKKTTGLGASISTATNDPEGVAVQEEVPTPGDKGGNGPQDMPEVPEAASEEVPPAPKRKEFVEWKGEAPYFTEFIDVRSITKSQALKGWGVTIEKDLVWKTGPDNRMILPKEDIPAEALPHLLRDPSFVVVEI